jgi:2-keto-3-deoxy-L-rhamnonate aldolase RhmA
VVAAARRDRKAAGIQPGSLEEARQWRAMGFSIISFTNDVALYRDTLARSLSAVREAAGEARRG